ncbi:MAG: hypothetical protein ACTSXA_05120, partial [Candidatus Heimdallarchaeota archaeon]
AQITFNYKVRYTMYPNELCSPSRKVYNSSSETKNVRLAGKTAQKKQLWLILINSNVFKRKKTNNKIADGCLAK